jgi:hypothetical protein
MSSGLTRHPSEDTGRARGEKNRHPLIRTSLFLGDDVIVGCIAISWQQVRGFDAGVNTQHRLYSSPARFTLNTRLSSIHLCLTLLSTGTIFPRAGPQLFYRGADPGDT